MTPAVRGKVGNLPVELTSFVGRRRELTEVKRLLSVARLVTLTGIGGVGKTRLALRVAADSRRAFDDGVWLVELGELRDTDLVVDTVAAVLGLREESARAPLEVLTEYLADRRLLLVLDNCEHLVEAAATLTQTLLRSCPELHVLATSREPLGIGGEAVLRVPPLSVPSRPLPLRGLPSYDAVALFVQRAVAAVPEFELTEDNRVTVTRICQHLDGLPLPIELAAARLRAMSATDILDRLSDRYRLLAGGRRGVPTRQQTLRLSVDWSYDLCEPEEARLWARLSVFAGGFELDAAETICAGDPEPETLLDVMTSLVDKSILIREEPSTAVRYRMLETLREYGREKLQDTGESAALRRRHRDWYEQLVLRADTEWIGPNQLEWIARLEREHQNLREALRFCLTEHGESEHGLRLVAALNLFVLARGMSGEGRYWLDRVLAHHTGAPSVHRVDALCADSVLAGVQGDLRTATALVEEGRVLAEAVGEGTTRALVAHADGLVALHRGDLDRSVTSLDAAVAVFRTVGDLRREVEGLTALGLATALRGDTPRAISQIEEVLAITELHGESVQRAYSLWALGLVVWQDEPRRASGLFEQSLRLSRRSNVPLSSALCLDALAWIAAREQQARRSAVLLGAAEALSQAIGNPTVTVPHLRHHHDECEQRTRRALGERAFEAQFRHGKALSFADALAFALDEEPRTAPLPRGDAATSLTRRERQVADLVAQGLTNGAIADRLVISPRTAQGHVEHVLAKLGFTSRAQIAAWVVGQSRNDQP
ncbi:ATP-binding protein [Rhodococcus sp. NPDC056960]|uniref:ATP-binding protein n=1 Tax=Rhodococcus sp. NPDC056960 TaxID=3345982 RepID=UPI0036339208